MHTSSNREPHIILRPGYPRTSRLLRTVAVAAASLWAIAGAQPTDSSEGATLVGIHYQDLLPTDGDTIQVFLPRPQTGAWEGVMLSSSDECLELGELGDPGPEYVLVLDARLPGSGAELNLGTSCSASIVSSFRSGDVSWEGTTLVTVNRLAYPPAPDGVIEATLTLDRISLPVEPGAPPMASLVTLTITNRAAEPITLLGMADAGAFTAIVGSVYQYDEPLDGTLAGLEAKGRRLTSTTLAPGASTSIALVLDPESRLPDGSAVLTVQPSLLVSITGTTYSLRFERLSTAWGNELP